MKHVLCIGSVTTDILVTPADSIPTPGTLRAVDSLSTHVGGCAANSAIDLGKLGVPVTLCCKVGQDNFGDFVIRTAKASGVDTGGVIQQAGVSTTASVVCIASSGERSFLYLPGSAAQMTREDISDELLARSDIVFVAGAMLLSAFDGKPCAALMKQAKALGKCTIMDTAWDFEDLWLPKVADVLPYLDWFVPSYEEAAKLTGQTDPQKVADRLFELGAKNVIVKLGKEGALLCPAGEERVLLPTYRSIKAVDTTGAGDAFCAGFIAGLSQGWDTRQSVRFANAVGTHCVTAIGASTGIKSIQETLAFMKTHSV